MGRPPWAWITSALTESTVEKAIVLAVSLRQVKTSGKLVVITSSHLSEEARMSLYNHFDLVCIMDTGMTSGSGFSTCTADEDHAKVFAFSLSLFQHACCVYISPNSLVLRKCDALIESDSDFFMAFPNESTISSAMFAFTPSVVHFHALRQILRSSEHEPKDDEDMFTRCVGEYARNNNLKLKTIEKQLYHQLKEGKLAEGDVNGELAIINFGCIDPFGAYTKPSSNHKMGLIESYAIDRWWRIYHKEIYLERMSPPPFPQDMHSHDSVAIIGISCRFPGASSLDEFWNLLLEGREGIKQLPPHRWQKGHTITRASSKCRKTQGGFLDEPIDEFDSKFFNFSQKEAEFLDPQQRLLHEVSWEALEDAAIDILSLREKHVGVYVGSWIHDYKDLAVKTADRDFFRIYMGNSIAATAARLSFLYGITGPSIALESGCSSAMVAVNMACKSLRSGETNMALAAGVNLFLHPFNQTTMSFVLAPDGRCKAFDANADGFGRAEGAGVLVLKRMSDAIADGDKIWALIRGSAISQEGMSKSLGTPTIHCESLAMELALKDANVQANDVTFLEAHGTGTAVGDPLEIAAIAQVYSKHRTDPLYISSVKTNLGHTEAASGITGIIKVVLQMQNETIVPHLNFSQLNPEINLDAIPARIPLSPVEWKRVVGGKPRLAGVSSFGISGTDGHVIIQEAPGKLDAFGSSSIDLKMERPYHVMKITAKTSQALDQLLASYATALEQQLPVEKGEHANNDKFQFPDIAYTANVGRASFSHRAVIVARDGADAVRIIKGGSFKRKEVSSGGTDAKVCLLFTGQGSQYKNMARELYLSSPTFRLSFDKCKLLLETQHNLNICSAMWTPNSKDDDAGKLLDRTLYSQVAIFVVEYCLLRLWQSWGVKPHFALGHSLGEFAAAICCGVLSLESALELVVKRSKLIDGLPEGKMLVLKCDQDETERLLEAFKEEGGREGAETKCELEFAAFNSSEQTVLAGDSELVDRFCKFCAAKDIKSVVLAATHAFHCHHMDPILESYGQVVDKVIAREKLKKRRKTGCQFISGVEGKLVSLSALEETLLSREYWIRHTRHKVNFLDASKAALQEGCNIFLEVGPSPVLLAFVLKNNADMGGGDIACLPSLRKNQNEWVSMLESLSRLFLSDQHIDWKGFDRYYNRCKVSLPFYPFQRKKIWVDFRKTAAQVHPMIGRVLPNASKSTIFESEFTLKQIDYLRHHAIGNRIVLPGAAMLEMCVVAGHCAVQGLFEEFCRPRRGLILKGLRIEAPLAIQDGQACILQTVVDLNEGEHLDDDAMGYSVKIYNWLQNTNNGSCDNGDSSSSEEGHWKRHASAVFLPLVTAPPPCPEQVDIDKIQEKWEKLAAANDLYERLPEVGLVFGSSFQSLVCGWKHERKEGSHENQEEEGVLFQVKVPTDDLDVYLVHPVVLDAMLQATMLWTNKERIHKKLHVPVHIREYCWLSDGDGNSSVRYVYVSSTTMGELPQTTTLLLDSCGSVLASMSGIDFVETSVKLVESMIQQQSSAAMPQLWEEIWKPKKGPLHGRAKPAQLDQVPSSESALSREVLAACSKLNELDEQELRAYRHLDELTLCYFLNALYKLGWIPKLGEEIVLREFMEKFGIVGVAWNFLRYFFTEMVADGLVQVLVNEHTRFVIKIVKLPRVPEEIEQLCLQTVVEGEASRQDYRILSEMGKGLKDFLVGNSSPLGTLFPEDPSKPNLGCFYDEIRPWVSKSGEILNNALASFNHLFYTKDTKDSVVFRVLEVGSGTGSGTKDYLEFLESKQVNFEYTFSDISAAFFINAEVKFEKYREHMQFKKFNIEQDPLAQGFTPEYYDLVIACEVIHATRDIRETLRNLRVLLKSSGHIQITETTKPDRRITLLVGMLEGYWRMKDLDLRPCHATISGEKWISVLKSTGFTMASSIGCYQDVHSYVFAFAAEDYSIEFGTRSVFDHENNEKCSNDDTSQYTWLIFCDESDASREIQRRLKCLNRRVVAVDKASFQYHNLQSGKNRSYRYNPEMDKQEMLKLLTKLEGDTFEGVIYLWALSPSPGEGQKQLSLPFLHLCQNVLELHKATARLYVLTRGAFISGHEDSACVNPGAATLWGIAKTLRNEQPDISMHCIDLSPEQSVDELLNQVFYEFFWSNGGEELLAFRDGKRLVPRLASLKIPDDSQSLPPFCDRFQLLLPSTKTIADVEFGFLNQYTLKDDEIEIEVKCCALNFRDIFAVLKPTSQFESINSVGSDFAGVVTKVGGNVTKWRVGDPVFGMNTEQQALPSHLKTKENLVLGVPPNYTFAEAATIPAAFATALYCLVKVARVGIGDVCLIHTASGGVGLAAVQIAKHFGAVIIATAGSRRKRAYLKSLGIQHVFHSRNCDYGEKIVKVTHGRGVDIVLNSLTGPGFIEASLKACAGKARFVEMSKLNIWTAEQVQQVRQDIEYTVADLTCLEEEEWTKLVEEMKDCMTQNFIKPIPYTRFDALKIVHALAYLQKAKHIGKVVCVMPELKTAKKHRAHHQYSNKSHKTFLFNDRSTYLITGGLGGIGFETAKFMLDSGASHLILASRSAPKPEVEAAIKCWNAEGEGKRVEAWQVDVGNYEQVEEMVGKITVEEGWPPLRGIMHAAGVLCDGTIPNQSWEKFQTTYNAKVRGTINLHNISRDLQLEHFVLFSSVTSLFGSPGQCNHCASNAFEDAFAHYRHSVGLPATSINFANWGEVGVATEIDFPGIRPIATSQGLRSIEAILKANRLQTCVMNVDSFGLVVKLFPKVKGYLDDKRLLGDVKAPALIINTDQFWGEVDSCEAREGKADVFKRHIKNMLRNTLKMDPDENIDDHAEFQGLGVDSLMLLEMKNYLQNLFGSRLMLTAAHLKDCNCTATLAARLVDVLEGSKSRNATDGEGDEPAKADNNGSAEDTEKKFKGEPKTQDL